MRKERAPIVILLDEDDEEDHMRACDALAESRLSNQTSSSGASV
jgi:DNA-binding response OmpR family regulator